MTYRFGFVMAQVAGHVTAYRNLRRVTEADPSIHATWSEVSSYRAGGRLERVANRLGGRGLSLRPVLDLRRALKDHPADGFDAMLINTTGADWYRPSFGRTPTVIDFDATPALLQTMPDYGPHPKAGPVEAVKRRVRSRLWAEATLLQAWSAWAKASAVDDHGLDPAKVIVNPPGVDLERWTPGISGARDGPLRVLFVGGDFRRKGGDLLLDWFGRAAPDDVELHLVTRDPVGAGNGISVHHGVEANSDRLVDLYQQADVFVLPSRAECFGIATVEAMASGLPAVVSDVGASPELVIDGENGFVVRAGDATELGNALTMLLADEPLRRRMSNRSREIAEERFDMVRNAGVTLTEMKRLAASSN